MLPNHASCSVIQDDLDDTWGSDFDDDVEEDTKGGGGLGVDLYEIPDGKPSTVTPPPCSHGPSTVPEWLQRVEEQHTRESLMRGKYPPIITSSTSPLSSPTDENVKPQSAVYIENVLLPTKATKDDDSKNFIEALKRKLSQKNLLVSASPNNSTSAIVQPQNNNGILNNTKPCSGSGNNRTNNNTTMAKLPEKPETERLSGIQLEGIKKIKESVQKFPWFYRVDRTKAELILENYTNDGAFLVRECHHGGPDVPFTLTIRYALRLFHIQIRVRPDAHFALGSAKTNEMKFGTIQEMIDTYRKTALQLHTAGKYFGETKLTSPPIVYSFSK